MRLYKILQDAEVFSNLPAAEFSSKYEAEIVLETLRHLRKISPDLEKEFSIVILLNNGVHVKKWDLGDTTRRKKIFIISDEKGRTPLELVEDPNNIVFHAHLSFSEYERKYPNLFHYPLGCNSFVPALPYVAASERNINMFFSGNLHAGRANLYRTLTKLSYVPLPFLTRIQKYLKLKFDSEFPHS